MKCDDFAVNHGLVRQLHEAPDDGRIADAEVIVVARPKLHAASRLEGNGTVAVELQLVLQSPAFCGSASVRSNGIGSMKRAFFFGGIGGSRSDSVSTPRRGESMIGDTEGSR
jgi:hypothetical protein